MRRAMAEKRIELAPLRRRIAAAEAEIARLTAEIAGIDQALAEPGRSDRDPSRAVALAKARADNAAALARAEEDWLEASADFDSRGRPDAGSRAAG
jgi:ATP-binding cassette subfamily F protein 3